MLDLKEVIKKRRQELCLSQADVAARMKVKPQSFISKIERGERKITLDDIALIEKAYRIKIDFVITEV